MSLENIINEVELFEIIKNEKVISSSTPSIQHVNNAIHNITNVKIKKSIVLESEYTKILEVASNLTIWSVMSFF